MEVFRTRSFADAVRHVLRRGVGEARGRLDWLAYDCGLRSTDALRLPDFLGVGAQKAGSTWLHANLVCHPGLFLPAAKELHYFDWFRTPTLARYAAEFDAAGDRVAGEITPGYSALTDRRVERVHRLLPHVRVLLLLRDPVERAWSQVRMDLVRRQGIELTAIRPADVERHLTSSGAARRGDYGEFVARWRRIAGERLWIGDYADIAAAPADLLRSVFTHLGVDADLPLDGFPLTDRLNPGGDIAMPLEIATVIEAHVGHQRDAMRDALGR